MDYNVSSVIKGTLLASCRSLLSMQPPPSSVSLIQQILTCTEGSEGMHFDMLRSTHGNVVPEPSPMHLQRAIAIHAQHCLAFASFLTATGKRCLRFASDSLLKGSEVADDKRKIKHSTDTVGNAFMTVRYQLTNYVNPEPINTSVVIIGDSAAREFSKRCACACIAVNQQEAHILSEKIGEMNLSSNTVVILFAYGRDALLAGTRVEDIGSAYKAYTHQLMEFGVATFLLPPPYCQNHSRQWQSTIRILSEIKEDGCRNLSTVDSNYLIPMLGRLGNSNDPEMLSKTGFWTQKGLTHLLSALSDGLGIPFNISTNTIKRYCEKRGSRKKGKWEGKRPKEMRPRLL